MKRILVRLLAVLLLLGGCVLVGYPYLYRWTAQRQADQTIVRLQQSREEEDAALEPQRPYAALYQDMQRYNAQIYEEKQSGLTDAWSYEQAPFRLPDYDAEGEAVGYLTIDAMDLQLPVYLGATRENMARGAAVLGQTSMPIGGENTNCVLAGHRGWQGSPMFLDIEKLQPGDEVVLDTLWETLHYRVCEIRIIQPDDIDAVKIQEGRDLLTLVTCHPYPTNAQRYLVYCERSEEEPAATSQPDADRPDPPAPQISQQAIDREKRLNALGVLLAAAAVLLLLFGGLRRRKKRRPPKP